jgi:hypothetical protein
MSSYENEAESVSSSEVSATHPRKTVTFIGFINFRKLYHLSKSEERLNVCANTITGYIF